jgi:hypothetical protein
MKMAHQVKRGGGKLRLKPYPPVRRRRVADELPTFLRACRSRLHRLLDIFDEDLD